jgi:hypothetical protein
VNGNPPSPHTMPASRPAPVAVRRKSSCCAAGLPGRRGQGERAHRSFLRTRERATSEVSSEPKGGDW